MPTLLLPLCAASWLGTAHCSWPDIFEADDIGLLQLRQSIIDQADGKDQAPAEPLPRLVYQPELALAESAPIDVLMRGGMTSMAVQPQSIALEAKKQLVTIDIQASSSGHANASTELQAARAPPGQEDTRMRRFPLSSVARLFEPYALQPGTLESTGNQGLPAAHAAQATGSPPGAVLARAAFVPVQLESAVASSGTAGSAPQGELLEKATAGRDGADLAVSPPVVQDKVVVNQLQLQTESLGAEQAAAVSSEPAFPATKAGAMPLEAGLAAEEAVATPMEPTPMIPQALVQQAKAETLAAAQVSGTSADVATFEATSDENMTDFPTLQAMPRYTSAGCLCQASWIYDRRPDRPCKSYCCNPDGDLRGDWCFAVDPFSCPSGTWGYCAQVPVQNDGILPQAMLAEEAGSQAGAEAGRKAGAEAGAEAAVEAVWQVFQSAMEAAKDAAAKAAREQGEKAGASAGRAAGHQAALGLLYVPTKPEVTIPQYYENLEAGVDKRQVVAVPVAQADISGPKMKISMQQLPQAMASPAL